MMIKSFWRAAAILVCLALAATTQAQTTTGTISGRVVDAQGLALPGVTVNAASPNLQGVRTTTTSQNGDYTFTGLPPGTFRLTFELSGFQKAEKSTTLAPTETVAVDATLGVGGVSESIKVVANYADVLTQTAQVASNFTQDLVSTLPTNRDINSALLLAPAIHPTGPNGAYSIAGAMSFESLFMVNGVNVNENLRGQANDLYIEDAVQETHIATAGISAEYGRFGGGVVNVITKSGGNTFSGSLRDTLNNDRWRALTPFEQTQVAADPTHRELRIDKTVPTYEYTLGGPILKDRLWFFTAGRLQTQQSGRSLVVTNIPYIYTDQTRRFEEKGTYSLTPNHTFQGAYTKIIDNQTNDTFQTTASMDVRSLDNRKLPQDLATGSYNGAFGSHLTVEARLSQRHFSFIGSGAPTTDLIQGTLLIDNQRGTRYWSPTFCGICDPEKRDNTDVFAKGTYFLSTKSGGSHNLVFGYDLFNDKRFANNHQSGSDYRILTTSSFVQGQDVIPEILGDGTTTIQWNPIPQGSQGTNFRTHSAFVNDNWRVTSRLTANVGLRYDKNRGADSAGRLVARDSAFSPRVGIAWDPTGSQTWNLTASFAKYVSAISNSIADSSSAAGNPQTFRFAYRGPSINADGPVTPTADAIKAVFDWFFANGGANLPLSGAPTIPGFTPVIQGSLDSPNNLEYAAGVSRRLGSRATVRADYVFRDYRDFYVTVQDQTTGKVTNSLRRTFDLGVIRNSNDLTRRYSGLTAQGTYRFSSSIDAGATYTLSRAWGNVEGENVGSGPITSGVFAYPEYKQAAWNYPIGDLSIDQRHRARMWVTVGVPHLDGLNVSVLQTLTSGVPYGAVGPIATQAYVANPGYATPPANTGSSAVSYFFTPRDAFRTRGERRTDLAVNYNFAGRALARLHPFAQLQVINVFDNFQLCGCGATVFANGGNVTQTRIDQTVLTASNSTQFTPFNPFVTTPVQGTNWALAPTFGTALNRFAYTTPRELRVSFGVRF